MGSFLKGSYIHIYVALNFSPVLALDYLIIRAGNPVDFKLVANQMLFRKNNPTEGKEKVV